MSMLALRAAWFAPCHIGRGFVRHCYDGQRGRTVTADEDDRLAQRFEANRQRSQGARARANVWEAAPEASRV
jgi:hypothetical protein